jgi:hypothetical protein
MMCTRRQLLWCCRGRACMVFMPWCGWSPVIRLHITTAKLYTCGVHRSHDVKRNATPLRGSCM